LICTAEIWGALAVTSIIGYFLGDNVLHFVFQLHEAVFSKFGAVIILSYNRSNRSFFIVVLIQHLKFNIVYENIYSL